MKNSLNKVKDIIQKLNKNQKTKAITLAVIGILVLLVLTFGVTYALFSYTRLGTTENIVTTGTMKLLYIENDRAGNGINMTEAYPISDDVGKTLTGDNNVFDFTIEGSNSSNQDIYYQVVLRKKADSTLAEEAVKVYLTDMTEDEDNEIIGPTKYSDLTTSTINKEETEKIIYSGALSAGKMDYTRSFRLRIWFNDEVDFSSGNYNEKTFTTLVNVYADTTVISEPMTYKEWILNGTDPVLKDNLIPVTISEDGTVKKANINEKWYSYKNKEWANAVILKDEKKVYSNEEVIPETNIESYFVWIPRYKYQIFDEGNYTSLTTIENKVQTINVVFENKDITPSNGTTKDSWLTHPAFTSFDSNGFWVGKFETGYDGAVQPDDSKVNSVDTSKIIIKPNVYSWLISSIGSMFKNSYDYKRDLDSHMMKNTEWGAVAYLQHSAYGSKSSVRNNNNVLHITGYAATEEPTKGYSTSSIEGNRFEATSLGVDGTYTINYFNPNSVVASTTGNKTGIYDMSGGVWEYVMGYTTASSTTDGNSGIISLYPEFFTDSTYTKYWDKYTSTISTQFNYRLLGDATGEMGPFGNLADGNGTSKSRSSWYGDYAHFTFSSSSWFMRGGGIADGTIAGIFAFGPNNGSSLVSYRIVLTPSK